MFKLARIHPTVGNRGLSPRICCKICHDFTARLSDISVGGVGTPEGWTTIIVRNEKGRKIIEEAEKEGYIETLKLSEEDIQKIIELAKVKQEFGVEIKT